MDERARELERLAAGGDVDAGAALLANQIRLRIHSHDDARVMAFFDDPAAQILTGIPPFAPRLSDYLKDQEYLFDVFARWLAIIFKVYLHQEFREFPGHRATHGASFEIFAGENEWVELMFGYRGFLSAIQIMDDLYSEDTESSVFYRTGSDKRSPPWGDFTGEDAFYLTSLCNATNAALAQYIVITCRDVLDPARSHRRIITPRAYGLDAVLDLDPFNFRVIQPTSTPRIRRSPRWEYTSETPMKRDQVLYGGILILLYILVRRKHPKAFTQDQVDTYFPENYVGADAVRDCLLHDHIIIDEEAVQGLTAVARHLTLEISATREHVNKLMLNYVSLPYKGKEDWIMNELKLSEEVMELDAGRLYLEIRELFM